MNARGNVGPIAEKYDANGAFPAFRNVSEGGHTCNVYKGTNGTNAVYSFLRTRQTKSGTVDSKPILNWIKGKGWFGDVTQYKVQPG